MTLPSTPPTLVQAVIELPSGDWELRFDQRLRPATIPADNIDLRLNNQHVIISAGTVSGFSVIGTSNLVAGPPQPDEADYQVVSRKILSWRGVPATEFTGATLLTV